MKIEFDIIKKIFNWEKWSYDLIYLPIDIVWLYYSIRARAFWFFTPVNPSLIFSGFEGGSKKEMYDKLPKWSYPTSLLVNPEENIVNVKEAMRLAGLNFPVVVKPDSGMWGVLFRIIKNDNELNIYHKKVGEYYILQAFIDFPHEFSVFHIRYPGAAKGIITGLIVKEYLQVIGDGIKMLAELVAEHPFAKYKLERMKIKHHLHWKTIIPKGEKYILSLAGNHNHGAKFINLNHEIDQNLCDVFDRISNEADQFHFGRYDLKCTSLEDLKAGKNIKILEYNGAGAAITHVFDRNMSYIAALKEIIMHWQHLFRIGKINNKKGVPYWSFIRGYSFMQKTKKNFKRMREIDKTFI